MGCSSSDTSDKAKKEEESKNIFILNLLITNS